MRDRMALERRVDVVERLDILHNAAHIDGQTAFRYHAAHHVVDQHLLIAGGIEVAQLGDGDVAAAGQVLLQVGDDILVLALDPQNTPLRAGRFHGRPQAGDYLRRVMDEELLVHMGQRFALRAIGDDHLGAGLELDVGGKARPASPGHARRLHSLNDCLRRFHKILHRE